MNVHRVYQTIDAHTAGEPLRIIVSGVPIVEGATMLEKRKYFQDHLDSIRRCLMLEPRGHNDMYGCVITPAVHEGSDLGVLFMHNEGYSTMCGHGVIALVTAAVQNGLVRHAGEIRLDTPAGVVRASAECENGQVKSVAFENVPSFVFESDRPILGLAADIVFGGAFYALVESPVPIDGAHLDELRVLGMKIKRELDRQLDVVHPLDPGLRGIYGTIFAGPAAASEAHRRNVTIFADGAVDRSPCGTGTCGVLASRFARGLLAENDVFRHEGILGTMFTGRVTKTARVDKYNAVIPEITGSAHITGYHTFLVGSDDPLRAGFRI